MTQVDSDLQTTVEKIVTEFGGRVGVHGQDLRDGRDGEVALDADAVFPTASMIKLPVLLELFRQVEAGRLSLDQEITRRVEDHVGGSGVLRHLSAGIRLPIRDYAYLMMSVSDNLATNVLIRLVGIENVNANLADLGLRSTRLNHPIDFDYCWTDPSHLGVGTAREFSRLMELIYRRQVLSASSCEEMLRVMAGVGAERIGRYLPLNTYRDELRQHGIETGPTVRLAGKTGGLIGVRGHTAVIWGDTGAFVLTVMTDNSKDIGWGVEHDGILTIARIGQAVYDAWTNR